MTRTWPSLGRTPPRDLQFAQLVAVARHLVLCFGWNFSLGDQLSLKCQGSAYTRRGLDLFSLTMIQKLEISIWHQHFGMEGSPPMSQMTPGIKGQDSIQNKRSLTAN